MSNTTLPSSVFELCHPWQRGFTHGLLPRDLERERRRYDALKAEVEALLAREEFLRQPHGGPAQGQAAQLQEFEHRVLNGLQLVVSMLLLQSRSATPEASAQLCIAAGRIAALGRVHRRLNSPAGQGRVNFKEHLERLCDEISGALFEERVGRAVVVQCVELDLRAALVMPLGLIVNELITNAVKYAKGDITVRVARASPEHHSLSVLDQAPGLPPGYDPAQSRGLGMRIVLSLVKEIGGALRVGPGDHGRGHALRSHSARPRRRRAPSRRALTMENELARTNWAARTSCRTSNMTSSLPRRQHAACVERAALKSRAPDGAGHVRAAGRWRRQGSSRGYVILPRSTGGLVSAGRRRAMSELERIVVTVLMVGDESRPRGHRRLSPGVRVQCGHAGRCDSPPHPAGRCLSGPSPTYRLCLCPEMRAAASAAWSARTGSVWSLSSLRRKNDNPRRRTRETVARQTKHLSIDAGGARRADDGRTCRRARRQLPRPRRPAQQARRLW